MTCPKCNGKIQNIKSVAVSNNEVFKRKKCLECGHVFHTVEFEVEVTPQFKKEWNHYERNYSNRI